MPDINSKEPRQKKNDSGERSFKRTKKNRNGSTKQRVRQQRSSQDPSNHQNPKKDSVGADARNPKWAEEHIERLANGEIVQFRPVGNSMAPLIKSGALVTVTPRFPRIDVDDVVLSTVGETHYLHKVTKKTSHFTFEIGNMRGFINGEVHRLNIHGKVINIDNNGV